MELIRYTRVLRRWIALIVICPIIAAIGAAAVSFMLPPVYEAKVSLLVRPAQPLSVDPGVSALTSDQISRTYARLLVEPPILQKVISDLGLKTSPEGLSKQIKVTPQANTTILDVAVDDTDPALARDVANTLVQDFIQEIKQIEQQEGSQPNAQSHDNLVVVAPATTPAKPVSPNLALNVAIATAAGLLLALGVAFLVDYLDQSIKTDEDLTERLGLLPLAHIPFAPARRGRRGEVSILSHDVAATEAYKTLRTSLLFSSVDRDVHVIVVTSALPREGKSRTAANLAVALAEAGYRTLLIDCDFRRPSQNRIWARLDANGVTNLILQDRSEGEVVRKIEDVPNLWVLPVGPIPPNPSELLGSHRMRELLMKFRQAFTYLVIDTPPVTAVSDASIMAAAADATVLVAEQRRTTIPLLRTTKQSLDRVGARIIGVVVNKVREQSGEYYAYRYGEGETADRDGSTGKRRVEVAAAAAAERN